MKDNNGFKFLRSMLVRVMMRGVRNDREENPGSHRNDSSGDRYIADWFYACEQPEKHHIYQHN